MAKYKNDLALFFAILALSLSIENLLFFPFFVLNNGGFVVLLPKFLATILVTFPMILLELQMGKKYRCGQMGSFSNLNQSFGGIGSLTLLTCFVIFIYINVILSWTLYFFVQSFIQPSVFHKEVLCGNGAQDLFYSQLLGIQNQDCTLKDFENISTIQGFMFLGCVASQLFIVIANYKGAKSLQFFSIFSVPLLLALSIAYLVITSLLSGQISGIGVYFYGSPLNATFKNNEVLLGEQAIWSNSIKEVFFANFIALGAYTIIGKSIRQNMPILKKTFTIVVMSYIFSVLCGFIVYNTYGHIYEQNLFDFNIEWYHAFFVAIPNILSLQLGSNSLLVLFYLFVYLIGFSSQQFLFQSQLGNLRDLRLFQNMSKKSVILLLAIIQLAFQIPLCSNISLLLVLNLHQFMFRYLVPIIALFQCLAVGWIPKSRLVQQKIHVFFGVSFWINTLIMAALTFFVFQFQNGFYQYIPFCAMFIILILIILNTLALSKLAGRDFYQHILIYGPNKLSDPIVEHQQIQGVTANIFQFYFAMTIKYLIPISITFFLFQNGQRDINLYYLNQFQFHQKWIGGGIILIMLFIFFYPCFYINTKDNLSKPFPQEDNEDDIQPGSVKVKNQNIQTDPQKPQNGNENGHQNQSIHSEDINIEEAMNQDLDIVKQRADQYLV